MFPRKYMNDLFDSDLPPFNQPEDHLFGWNDADSAADADQQQSPLPCIDVDDDRQYSRGRRATIDSQQLGKIPATQASKQMSGFMSNQTIPEHQAAPAIPSDAPSLHNHTTGTPQTGPNRSSLDSVMSYANNMNVVDGFIQPSLQAMSTWSMANAGMGDMGAAALGYQGIVPGSVPQMQGIGYGMQPFNNFNSMYNKQQVEQYMGNNQDGRQRTRLSEDSVVSNTQFWPSMPSQGVAPPVHHMGSHDMNAQHQRNTALQSSFFSPSQAFQQPGYNYAQGAPQGGLTQGGLPAVNVQPQGAAMGGLAPADVHMGSGSTPVQQQQENGVPQVDPLTNASGLVGTARISLDSSMGGSQIPGGSSSRKSVDRRQSMDSAGNRTKGYFKQSAAQKEKMRRDKFSSLIARLRSLVPPSVSMPSTHSNQYCTDQRPKNAVLMDAIHYIEQLQGVQEGKTASEGMRSVHLTSATESVTSQQPDSKLTPTSSLEPRTRPSSSSLEITKASETSLNITLACPASPQLLADLTSVAMGLGLAVRKCNVDSGNNGISMVDCQLDGNVNDQVIDSLKSGLKGLLQPK